MHKVKNYQSHSVLFPRETKTRVSNKSFGLHVMYYSVVMCTPSQLTWGGSGKMALSWYIVSHESRPFIVNKLAERSAVTGPKG